MNEILLPRVGCSYFATAVEKETRVIAYACAEFENCPAGNRQQQAGKMFLPPPVVPLIGIMSKTFYGHQERARNDRRTADDLPANRVPKVLFTYPKKIRSAISQMGLFVRFLAAKRWRKVCCRQDGCS
ncbi:hypothetical protein [Bradyrhizobium ottawaense]|uniref:hypothetical protein n=1 Tax=Bradyrhizobium ottawaense TaxID=931866 RepID=UPI001FDF3149|nr:hypothetical protein [Bradyrhizobium ottawaense]